LKKLDYASGVGNKAYSFITRLGRLDKPALINRLSLPKVQSRLKKLSAWDDAVIAPRAKGFLLMAHGATPGQEWLGKKVLVRVRAMSNEILEVPCYVQTASMLDNGKLMLEVAPIDGKGTAIVYADKVITI